MFKKTISIAAVAFIAGSVSAQAANIVETAASTGKFNTLIAAAKAAGLAGALSGKGPLTVFAPTDAAFAKLPKGTVENLLKPENKKQLADILKYHVVKGAVTSAHFPKGRSRVTTIKGSGARFLDGKLTGARLTVDGARVTTADIKVDNGVIHIIDKVMLPSS